MTSEQQASFREQGYIIVPDVFTPEQCAAALAEVEQWAYGMPFDAFLKHVDEHGDRPDPPSHGMHERAAIRPAVDALFEHDPFLDLCEACLGDNASHINSSDFVRTPYRDTRGQDGEHGGWHIDHHGFSYLPYHRDVQQFAYVNAWVYLHDIDDDGAPVNVLPGAHRLIQDALPKLIDAGAWNGSNWIGDMRKVRAVVDLPEPVAATGKAGSVLIYSSYLLHRAVPFINMRKQRALWHVSLARRDAAPFTHFVQTYDWETRKRWVPFWCRTTARVRGIFGWPEAGDAYYTPDTLKVLAAWYPEMDLSEYEAAMRPTGTPAAASP